LSEPPSAEEQLTFLFRIQRILTEGVFESTYEFALLELEPLPPNWRTLVGWPGAGAPSAL